MQTCGFCQPAQTDCLRSSISACIDEASRLLLNHSCTRVLWSPQFVISTIFIGDQFALAAWRCGRLLWYVTLELKWALGVTMQTHVQLRVWNHFAALRSLRCVRHSLPHHAALIFYNFRWPARSTTVSQPLMNVSHNPLNHFQF